MTASERLLAAAKEIWEGYYTHPFVRGIADGTLDRDRFRYYLIQDYLYLIDYTRVFGLGVAKAGDLKTMTMCAGYISAILETEMDIHRSYMERFGISLPEAEAAVPALANRSYTSYMLRVAYEEGIAEIIAAILSCAVSYEYIGRRILREHPASAEHPLYGQWVRSYSSQSYADGDRIMEELMDRLAAGYTEEQLQHLEEIFVACSRYEAEFWDMAWDMKN